MQIRVFFRYGLVYREVIGYAAVTFIKDTYPENFHECPYIVLDFQISLLKFEQILCLFSIWTSGTHLETLLKPYLQLCRRAITKLWSTIGFELRHCEKSQALLALNCHTKKLLVNFLKSMNRSSESVKIIRSKTLHYQIF